MLRTYREAADVVEASDLNYTLIRPGWFTGGPVDYEITKKANHLVGMMSQSIQLRILSRMRLSIMIIMHMIVLD